MFDLLSVSVRRGNKQLLTMLNASFSPSSLQLIIGPNGAGKSTLLSTLAGFTLPADGCVTYFGEDISKQSPHQLAQVRAFLGQYGSQSLYFSVADILSMGRYPFCSGRLTSTDEALVNSVARHARVEHLLSRQAHTLSGGELQRVHFARVLAQCYADDSSHMAASLLLLDEPLNHLDLNFQHIFLEHLRQLVRQTKLCVVAVLHDLNLVAAYADAVYAIKAGKLLAHGVPRAVMTPALLQALYEVPFSVFSSGESLHVAYGARVPAHKALPNVPCGNVDAVV